MTEPDNVYVNLSFYCKKNNIADADIPAVFYSNRNIPILENAGEYEMSIARFDIESQNIPILIPSIQTGQGDVNLTNYCVQIKQIGGDAGDPVYLEYVCKNKYSSNVPTVAGADSPYYYMYNVQHVVDMFNVACASAISGFDGLAAPFMKYNNDNTFSIYFDSQFESDYTFYVNDYLFNLFRNFNYTYESNNGINNAIVVQNMLGLNRTTINNVTYDIMTQNYNSMSVDWSPVSSIVFTSTYLPIVPEERIPTANIINGTTNSSNDVEQQITDIVLSVDNPNDYNNCITYVATTNYRRISLNAKEVREIDLKVYWRSKLGVLYPIMLSDGNSCSMKLKFEKRKY